MEQVDVVVIGGGRLGWSPAITSAGSGASMSYWNRPLSALLYGVGEDAAHIVEHLAN